MGKPQKDYFPTTFGGFLDFKENNGKFGKECKEGCMELAKLTSKGQITIPVQIRKKLKLKEGDKVFFSEEKGKIIFQNASQVSLATIQKEMAHEGEKAGFSSEEDVIDYIKKIREEQ